MRLHCRNIDSPIVSLALLQANASLKGCARLARPRPFNRKTTKKIPPESLDIIFWFLIALLVVPGDLRSYQLSIAGNPR